MSLKVFVKKVYRKLFTEENEYKTYQEYHEAENKRIAEIISSGGGIVGEDVDFYDVKMDLGIPAAYRIGSHVTLTNCRLLTHDASITKATGCTRLGHIWIGDNVFVGADSIVLPNTSIGSNVIIGAGAVIAKDIPDNSVVVGNPARVICSYDEFINKEMLRIKNNPPCLKGKGRETFKSDCLEYQYVRVRNNE